MKEEALLFGHRGSLVGVMTDPPETEAGRNLPAVLLLNAGIVHRVGPNRLYVKIARMLAAMGFVALRFDFSGIGDSGVPGNALPFAERAIQETQEAMSHVSTLRGIKRFVLMGICSGATVSFRTACRDPRVAGVVLINARGHLHDANDRSDAYIRNHTLARHYMRLALFSSFRAKNWMKAITGKVDYLDVIKRLTAGSRIGSLFAHKGKVTGEAGRVAGDLRSLSERKVRLLNIYSEGDEGLDYLHVILGDKLTEWRASGSLRLEMIEGANHTFTLIWSQEHLLKVLRGWMQEMVQDFTASAANQARSREVIQTAGA
jgi:pimeloyl-ACP methyl ester carboxylesterase